MPVGLFVRAHIPVRLPMPVNPQGFHAHMPVGLPMPANPQDFPSTISASVEIIMF